MQAEVEISMEHTDTLQCHYVPTNDIPEEALALIEAWEASVSKHRYLAIGLESNGADINLSTNISEPPQRYYRKPFIRKQTIKNN